MKLKQYRITYIAQSDAVLPGQLGSMLRGVFGETLMEYDVDLYKKFFEPEIDKDNPAFKYVRENPPSPFIFYPVKKYDFVRKNDRIIFVFTLIGEYRFYESNIIDIFRLIEIQGLNKNQLPVKLESIEGIPFNHQDLIDFSGFNPPEKDISTIEMVFKTPFSISHNKQLIADFDFNRLFQYIYRRIFILDQLYGAKQLPEQIEMDIENLEIHPLSIQINKQSIFRSPTRSEKYPMVGWKGNLRYGGNITPVLPYLQLGQLIHIGSYTVFGLGKYVLKY